MSFADGINLFTMKPVPNDEIPKERAIIVVSKINPPYTVTPTVLMIMEIALRLNKYYGCK